MEKIIFFGIRSPLLPDYEETCSRLGLQIAAAVRVDSRRPRILDRRAIIDLSDLDERQKNFPFVACAFYPKRRGELVAMASEAGLVAAEALIDPTAIIASSTRFGNGSFINAGVVIGAAGVFGEYICINRSTNIGHHAFFDDLVAIGPGVTIAGNVHIGKHSFVGAGSVVLPGVRIGKRAIVAAGSVVRHHVSDEVLVAGNPARVKRHRGTSVYGVEGEE
jgi:sugar O-acyltransferase (sialic acid O-acetyltransferase NeuD family)